MATKRSKVWSLNVDVQKLTSSVVASIAKQTTRPTADTRMPRGPALASKASLRAPTWQIINDRKGTPAPHRVKMSAPRRRLAPLRSKRSVYSNADAMDVDHDSSSDEGAWRPILATDFVKAAKKNPKPELASEVEEISDDSDEPYVAPRGPDIIAISSDSEDEVTILDNDEEEDELDLDRPPSEKLLEALKNLSSSTRRPGSSHSLPFLRRCVRRGFLLTCRRRSVPLSDGRRDDTEAETVYEYVIQNGVEYQARRVVRGYECPLCDLHGSFASKAVYEKHLLWDHPQVKFETTEVLPQLKTLPSCTDLRSQTDGKRKVVVDLPAPRRAAAR